MNNIILPISIVVLVFSAYLAYFPETEQQVATQDLHGLPLNIGAEEVEVGQVAQLDIVTWSSTRSAQVRFQVKLQDGKWVIPSQYNYPADGGTRVGDTNGTFLNVKRGRLVTEQISDHEELEVLDPSVDGLLDGTGLGKRVTLRDAGGTVLVDLIIGKPDGEGGHYVRIADEDKVYAAEIRPDLRTSFADWVERSLFKETRSVISELRIEDYSVEDNNRIQQRSQTILSKESGLWNSPQLPLGKQIDSKPIDDLVNEFIALRLEGIRPFSLEWLQRRGFFVRQLSTGQQDIVGNEGRIVLSTTEGLRYMLFFGEVALSDEDDQSAERSAELAKAGDNRYMAVFVQYDPLLDQAYQDAVTKQKEQTNAVEKPVDLASLQQAGQQKAAELQARFGKFFYVISDDSFKKLRPAKDAIFIDPPEEDEETPDQ